MDKSLFYSVVVPINQYEQVLIGKRKEDGIWTTPSGGANLGETPEECAVRECFEESGLLVDWSRLESLGVKEAPNGKPVHCFLYRTTQLDTHVSHDPDKEVQQWTWVSATQLPKELTRKNNQNRLETINEAFMKYHGLKKSAEAAIWTTAKQKLKDGPEPLLKYIQGVRKSNPELASELYESLYPGSENAQATNLAQSPTPDLEKSKDYIPGGKADTKRPSNFNPASIKAGIKVESEHTNDPIKAKEIAMDHLTEDPDYYKDWENKEEILFKPKAPKLEKKQGVPKGANPATHERCVQHLKDQGHDKSSAFAICNAAGAGMKKANPGLPYDSVANVERKRRNTGEDIGSSTNTNRKEYTTSGSANTQASQKATEKRIKNQTGNKWKVMSDEEKRALIDKLQAQSASSGSGRGPDKQKRKTRMNKSNVINLLDKLNKGGPGSGKKGHTTVGDQHLSKLKTGGILEGAKTKSGKPIILNMDQAVGQGYTTEDHKDAMNIHYDLYQKINSFIDKHKKAGHKIPQSVKDISKFHERKFKAHSSRAQMETERQKKQESVKKAITQLGHQSPDINTADFALTNAEMHKTGWSNKLYKLMDGFNYGDEPRELVTLKGRLSLVKVDEGTYTGYFRMIQPSLAEDQSLGYLEDNEKMRIERITIPDLVSLLIAKEFIGPDEMVEPEQVLAPEPVDVEPLVAAIEHPLDRKIRFLELVTKLLQ